MALTTEREKRIHSKYSARDEHGYVHCDKCPLSIHSEETDIGCKAWMHYDRHLRKWVPDKEERNE